jgi:hypothetical protein
MPCGGGAGQVSQHYWRALIPQASRPISQHHKSWPVLWASLNGALPAQMAKDVLEGRPLSLFVQQLQEVGGFEIQSHSLTACIDLPRQLIYSGPDHRWRCSDSITAFGLESPRRCEL